MPLASLYVHFDLGFDPEHTASLDLLDKEVFDGCAKEVSGPIADQACQRNGPVIASREGVKHSQRARAAQFKHGSKNKLVGTTLCRAKDVAGRVTYQFAIRIFSIRRSLKAVQTPKGSSLGDLEDRPVARVTTRAGGAKQVAEIVQQ